MTTSGLPARLALTAGAAVAAFTLVSSSAGAAGCKSVSGKVSLTDTSTSGCTSAAGVCVAMDFGGSLSGSGQFVAASVTATVDTPTTGVVLLTGDTALTTKSGQLFLKDAWLLHNTGRGELSTLTTVLGSTGSLAGTTGVVQVVGSFVSEAGGSGVYTGELCQ